MGGMAPFAAGGRRRISFVVAALLLAPTWVLVSVAPHAEAVPVEGGIVPSVADVGWPDGAVSVSGDGAAQYNVPLWTPLGRNGMQPSLALSFNSRGGNGLVGVGWSLGGVESSITQCPRTFAQDGFRAGIQFDGTGALCLDGNRLVLVGSPASGQTEYRTQSESFSRIIAYGPVGSVPSYFRVWGKDGRIRTFGRLTEDGEAQLQAYRLRAGSSFSNPTLERESTTTKVTAAWLLHRVEDRNGNAYTVDWHASEGGQADLWYAQRWPHAVRYGANQSVVFSYLSRSDQIDAFDNGIHLRTAQRLDRISMYTGEDLVRQYQLGYRDDTITGRSLLTSIHECDGTVCKLPLEFIWSSGSYKFTADETDVTDAGTTDESGRKVMVGDVNADGRDDLLYANVLNDLMVRVSLVDRFGAPKLGIHRPTPSPVPAYRFETRPVDFNRDGRLDMMAEYPLPDWVGKTELGLFEYTDGYRFYTPDIDDEHESMSLFVPRDPAYFADLDGNGMPDYATPRQTAPASFPWHYKLNSGIPGPNRFGTMVTTTAERGISSRVRVLDSNGDGRDEILGLSSLPPYRYSTFGITPTGTMEPRTLNILEPNPDTAVDSRDLTLADVNGDGLPDAVHVLTGLRTQLNSGNGFGPVIDGPGPDVYQNPATYGGTNSPYDPGVRVVDFNNDGRDDILVAHPGEPEDEDDHRRGGQLYTWKNNQFVRVGLNRNLGPQTFFGFAPTQPLDVDGNGVIDLVHLQDDHLRLLTRTGGKPDQLIRISVGSAGPRVQFGYTTLGYGGPIGSHQPGACPTYPLVCPTRGGSVVSVHMLANGEFGGWNTYRHSYLEARVDVSGGGWLGFAKHYVEDLQTAAVTLTEFDNATRFGTSPQVFARANRPKVTTYTVDIDPDPQISRTYRRVITNEYDVVFPAPNVYKVELRTRVEDETEQPAAPPMRRVTTTYTYDAFGNKDLVETVTLNGRRVTEDPEFRNDTANWLLGLPTRLLTTGCTAGGACTTRRVSLDYKPNGNLKERIVEPDRPAMRLRTVPDYDQYGNITSTITSDAAGTARTELVGYDADGVHPATFTNALGHISRQTVDPGLGVVLDSTDPNGVKVAMRYDGFGRLRETNHVDGSFEHITHSVSAGGPVITATDAGGGVTTVVYDKLGRERLNQVKGFDGQIATVETSYDTLGRVQSVTRPYREGQTKYATTYTYDTRDRPLTVTEPDGAQVRTKYVGLETHIYDAANTHSYTVQTVNGDVESSYEDDPNATPWLRTRFEYGPFGELTRTVAPDNTVQDTAYDLLGRRISHLDPSAGPSSWTYNAFGEVITDTDGAATTSAFEYDALGRVKREASNDGEATYTWDTATYGIGKLHSARSADGVLIRYAYNDVGQTTVALWTIEGTPYEVNYGYDGVGRQSSIAYPRLGNDLPRLKVNYGYNPNGYLFQVTDASTGSPYWTAEQLSAAGQLERESYGNGTANVRTYRADNGLLHNSGTVAPVPGGTATIVDSITYEYYPTRNVKRRVDYDSNRMDEYTYDTLSRVKTWRAAPPNGGPTTLTATYTYDRMGNLKSETVAGLPELNATYTHGENGAPPHALTGRNAQQYTYDGAGRQITGPQRTVSYNRSNLPTSMDWGQSGHSDFKYDASGARAVKRDANQVSHYVPGLFERRTHLAGGDPPPDSTGVRNIHNIVADGRVVAQLIRVQAVPGGPITATQMAYQHSDGQGSTVLVTDGGGQVYEEMFYDPWGQRILPDYRPINRQGRANRLGYNGHEHDFEAELINMKGRIYDPKARRFLTTDPVVADPLGSQSHNRYSYVLNNPATLTDPSGLTPILTQILGDVLGGGSCGFSNLSQDPSCHQPDEHASVEEWRQYSDKLGKVIRDSLPTPTSDDDSLTIYAEGEVIIVPPVPLDQLLLEFYTSYHPDNYRVGGSGVRLRADFPRDFYYNFLADDLASRGYLNLAEIAEAEHGCAYCHIVKSYDSLDEANRAVDLRHYNQMAAGSAVARGMAEALTLRGPGGRFARNPNGTPKNVFSGHGNSINSGRKTYLYQLRDAKTGAHLKWGVTSEKNPFARYTKQEMRGRNMDIIASGTRRDMLAHERFLTERWPGPLNREPWAGTVPPFHPGPLDP